MVHALSNGLRPVNFLFPRQEKKENARLHRKSGACSKIILLFAAVLLSPLIFAQGNPQVTAVDPTTGKVNDSVTIAGANLGKGNVVAVFLSDDKSDYKGTIVDQSDEKIVMKIPQVKAGDYNISVQVGNNILIKPVRFTVQE
jgi:hypothetical protein